MHAAPERSHGRVIDATSGTACWQCCHSNVRHPDMQPRERSHAQWQRQPCITWTPLSSVVCSGPCTKAQMIRLTMAGRTSMTRRRTHHNGRIHDSSFKVRALMSLRFHHRNAPQTDSSMGGTFHPFEHCVLEVRVRKSMCHHAGQRLRVHAFNSTGDRAQASIRVSSLLLAVTVMGMLAIFVCRIAYLHAYFPDLLFPTKQRKTRHRVRNKMKNQARSSICKTPQQLFQDLNRTWLSMHDTHVSATKAC